MKGLILKIENQQAYIMKNNGSFKIVAASNDWHIGQVIDVKQKSEIAKKIQFVSAIVACLILFCAGGFYLWNTPVAYVDVAVNPNVELVLNRFDRIIAIDGLNDDGKKLIENTSINGLDINNAYLTLLDLLNGNGYLSKDGAKINLDVSHNNESSREKLQKLLTDSTNGFINKHGLDCRFNSNTMEMSDYINTHHQESTNHQIEKSDNNSSSLQKTQTNENHNNHDNYIKNDNKQTTRSHHFDKK